MGMATINPAMIPLRIKRRIMGHLLWMEIAASNAWRGVARNHAKG
jgi:hypothetical protein